MSRLCVLLACILLSACAGVSPKTGPEGGPEVPARIAVLGDSMMAWNGLAGASAPQSLARILDEPVANFAVSGARVKNPLPLSSLVGFDIRRQYRKGDWDVVLVNGGANDFFFGCGCGRCDKVLNRLAGEDEQTGALLEFLVQLRETGTQVIYVGYHRSRGLDGPVKGCRNEFDALDARVEKFAETHSGIDFVQLQDVFPVGDPKFYAGDRIHPSPLGSATIAKRLAPVVQERLAQVRR